MSPSEFLESLKESGIFIHRLELQRNERLSHRMDAETRLFWIEEGAIRLFIENKDSEQNIRFAYSNNLLTLLDSFLTGEPTLFKIEALRKSKLRYTEKQPLLDFISADPEYLKGWNALLEQLILQQMEREIDLLNDSAKERFERVLARSPQLFQEVPHKHIANYLRMSPETLSRLQKS